MSVRSHGPHGPAGRPEGVDRGERVVVAEGDLGGRTPALGTQPAARGLPTQPSTSAAPRWASATSASRSAASSAGPPTTATVRPVARSAGDGGTAVGGRDLGDHLLDAQRRRQPARRARVVARQEHRQKAQPAQAADGLGGARPDRSATSRMARATPSHDTATAVAPAAWIVVDGVGQLGGQVDPVPGEQGDAADQRRVRDHARLVVGLGAQLGDDPAHPEPGVAVELRDAGQLAEPLLRGVGHDRADGVAPGGAAGLPARGRDRPGDVQRLVGGRPRR